MRYGVLLHYHGDRVDEVEAALKPWKQWGTYSGDGWNSNGVNDIVWGARSLATAKSRAKKLHQKLEGIPHLIKVFDYGFSPAEVEDDYNPTMPPAIEMLRFGKMPRSRRSSRPRRPASLYP